MSPRRWFHALLGAIFVPLLSLPLLWGVAIHWVRRAGDVEARRWARRLVGLALIDTLVVVLFVVAAEAGSMEVPAAVARDRVMIGVTPDASSGGALESLVSGLGPMRGSAWLALAVPVVLLGPVAEELAFRGLLLPALCGWLKPAGAVALTAVLFASMNWYYGAMLPLVVFGGIVLGWARIASGGVRAPIVLHMLVNAASLLTMSLR